MKRWSFFRYTVAAALLSLPLVHANAAFELDASDIVADNSVQPNTVQLTFNNAIEENSAATNVANYTVTDTTGITYRLASAQITSSKVVLLKLVEADPNDTRTYITNSAITAHLDATVSTSIEDTSGNAYSTGTVTESGATATTDTNVPTLGTTITAPSSTTLLLTFSEKLAKSAATTASNYTYSVNGATAASASAASLDSSGTKVTITISTIASLSEGDRIVVTANSTNITDLAGNALGASANAATLTIDRTPAAISFATLTNAPISSSIASDAVAISGLNTPATLSVATGSSSTLTCATLSSTSTTWSSFGSCASTTVANGDQLKLQLTSASTALTTTSATIGIGGATASFKVTTAATLPTSSTVTFSAVTSLTSVLRDPDSSLYLSANGIMIVPASFSGTLSLLGAATSNAAFSLTSGGNVTFTLGTATQTFKPTGGDALAVLKSFTIDGTSGYQTLEVSGGRVVVTGSTGKYPIASTLVGTSTVKQVALLPVGSIAPVIDIQRNTDGTATIAVKSGKISLRLASSSSVVALSDASITIYPNEVINISAAGTVTKIRAGSLDGTEGVIGDPISTSLFPTNFTVNAQLPKLGAIEERSDPTKNLMLALFDFIGPRATLNRGTQTTYGVVPLLVDGMPIYFMPIGEVIVDTAATDGGLLKTNGRFSIVRNGVTVQLVPALADTQAFGQAAVAQGSSIVINTNGAYEMTTSGETKIFQPGFLTSSTSEPNGIGIDADGHLQFVSNGAKQTLYPKFYDMAQIATTFSSLDSGMSLQDNLDGTVTATIAGQRYTLRPDYEVLSPLGGIPLEHRNSSYWIANNLVYVKYSNGSAQGFSVE